LRRKLKIGSIKEKFILKYEQTQEKKDIRESGGREKHAESIIEAVDGSECHIE
jgi:hypothetical protein